MEDSTIIVAVISLFGTLVGSISGVLVSNKLSNYRIEQLEKKLDRYVSNVDEMRERIAVMSRDIETAFVRIDELRNDIRK